MPVRHAMALSLMFLGACGDHTEAHAAGPRTYLDANAWTIGPTIRGRNYSPGMPLHPTPLRAGGFQIKMPKPPASVHYVTFPHGSLTGKSRIVMRYRVEAEPGVRIVPTTVPALPSVITLYIQRAGDNWSGVRKYETYRWFATFASQWEFKPGAHVMIAPLNANWTAIETSSVKTNPAAFRDAIENADRVGFVLGGGDGYGHGVHAVGRGRARLIVTDFRVE